MSSCLVQSCLYFKVQNTSVSIWRLSIAPKALHGFKKSFWYNSQVAKSLSSMSCCHFFSFCWCLKVTHHLPSILENNVPPKPPAEVAWFLFSKTAGIRFYVIQSYSWTYILKTGFAGSQKPQKNLNFPQKDCLRTRKLSILQCVLRSKGQKEGLLPFYS